jgi:hypothetical protein
LFWQFVLFLGDNNTNFPSGLSHRFKQFETKLLRVAKHKTLVTKGLMAEDYSHLCKLMLTLKTDLSNVMKQCGLPFSKHNNQPVIRSLPSYWFSNKSKFDPSNLLEIAHRLNQDDRNCLYSSVLEDIPTEKLADIPMLVGLLKNEYSPYAENSQHHKLSDVAKRRLLELIGAMSFNDFKQLLIIRKIIESVTIAINRRTIEDKYENVANVFTSIVVNQYIKNIVLWFCSEFIFFIFAKRIIFNALC